MLTELTAYDEPSKTKRFTLVYCLLSVEYNSRLLINLRLDSNIIFSISSIYLAGNWAEREIRDMFGIIFTNNADLRRLLTDYGFTGFPLRKDFPLTGYIEVRYDDEFQRILYEPLELAQEFRVFSLNSP
jgi:NADH:ubiquinone oxidoreductase subunit C